MTWSEKSRGDTQAVEQSSISQDELFVRKLVDATLLSDQLYVHLSHESDDQAGEFIYITPFHAEELETFGCAIQSAIDLNVSSMASTRIEYLLWSEDSFQTPQQLFPVPTFKRDVATYLLNHYLVFGSVTYEVIFSIYDPKRDCVRLFLKEADKDEQ